MEGHRFDEIRLRDFRCFHTKQTARMAPLTLLVGDNSTGKTSFLAAIRAIWDVAYQHIEPDFRASPYDLGAFAEIVHNPRSKETTSNSFDIGFSSLFRGEKISIDVTFAARAAAPSPVLLSTDMNDAWIKSAPENPHLSVEFGSGDVAWHVSVEHDLFEIVPWGYFFSLAMVLRQLGQDTDEVEQIAGDLKQKSSDTIDSISNMLQHFSFQSARARPFASAPIRSSPHRTYDPTRPLADPEGAYVPTYFANVHFTNKKQWLSLKEKLEEFGTSSGLFDKIEVRHLGEMEGGPFQLEVSVKGRPRNLIDVGYGVSQVLPVLAELFRQDGPPVFLFQQPEVHLHPSAQAALGSLFCATVERGHQLVIETHSDYIVDRILLDIRDRKTNLRPDDVSILYFERERERKRLNVTIHSIRIDGEGNVVDPPSGYRGFFRGELNRVIDF